MQADAEEDFSERYLKAKRSVDDRALNSELWSRLRLSLRQAPFGAAPSLSVLEIGSGIGTMIERVLDWGLFDDNAQSIKYVAIDNVAANRQRTQERLNRRDHSLHLRLETADFYQFADRSAEQGLYDLVIANAFFDLVHLPSAFEQLLRLLKPGGLFYLTINFDGVTRFEPVIDQAFDQQIESLYHADMDRRRFNGQVTGGSQTGRKLLDLLNQPEYRGLLLASGRSDWGIEPQDNGEYAGDEAFFLQTIIGYIEKGLNGHPDLDPDRFNTWIERRREQIDAGELRFFTEQIDLLGKK